MLRGFDMRELRPIGAVKQPGQIEIRIEGDEPLHLPNRLAGFRLDPADLDLLLAQKELDPDQTPTCQRDSLHGRVRLLQDIN
ncbi:hypothetical protein D3C87_1852610 [compost metagenome]